MILTLDIGGSHIRIAEVLGTSVKNKSVCETPKNKKDILKIIFLLTDEYFKYKKFKAIGVGVAGMQKKGLVHLTPNMDFSNVPLKKILSSHYSASVFVENDAKCAGLAEYKYGAGRGRRNFVLLTLGTGIGGAIFIDGKLYRGNGFGAEPGHMFLNDKEFEEMASGRASLTIARKHGFKKESVYEIEDLARKKNKKALAVYSEIGRNLGIGLLNISYLLDPEIIILGGGFAKISYYWEAMREILREKDIAHRNISVVKANFGDEAGLIGAGMLPSLKN